MSIAISSSSSSRIFCLPPLILFQTLKLESELKSLCSRRRCDWLERSFQPLLFSTSAIPVRCSTNWAMKPHIGSEANLLSSYRPWGEKWCEVSDFFFPILLSRLLLSNCLNWKIYCEDHSSRWSTTAVQIYELFHIYFTSFHSSREIWTQ